MDTTELNLRLEKSIHLLNEIRYAENVLDELFFSRPTASIAPPPVNFFDNYTDKILQTVEEAKAAYAKNNSSVKNDIQTLVPTIPPSEIQYPDNFGEIIGQRIRDQRAALGLTQNDLAKRTGIRRPNIARLERGLTLPNLTTLLKVSSAIQIPLKTLLNS